MGELSELTERVFNALNREIIKLKGINADLLEVLEAISKSSRIEPLSAELTYKMMEAIDKAKGTVTGFTKEELKKIDEGVKSDG